MSARLACPDCQKLQAVLPPARAERTFLVECAHCSRRWAPGRIEGAAAGPAVCAEHRSVAARWVCDVCDSLLCDPCSRRIAVHGHDTRLSPCCRESCLPLARVRTITPFWSDLPRLLSHPVRGAGPWMLGFFFLLGFVPILGWFLPFLLGAWLVHVLRTSSHDPESAPAFPDFGSLVEDVVYPFLRLIAGSLIAWAPLLLYLRFTEPGTRARAIILVLAAAGAVYYPFVILVAAVCRSLRPVAEPALLGRILGAIRDDYAIAVLFLFGLGLLGWLGLALADRSAGAAALARVAHLYLLALAFHVLGRLVHQTRDRVDWEV